MLVWKRKILSRETLAEVLSAIESGKHSTVARYTDFEVDASTIFKKDLNGAVQRI